MRWLERLPFALVVGSLLLAGCGSNDTNTSPACVPSCRDGFVCSRGACVSACNPECRSGEVCVPNGTSFTCATLPADSGAGNDASQSTDTPAATDTPAPPSDVPSALDAPMPPGDAPTPPPTDSGMASDATAATDSGTIPCGAVGQGCCFMRACNAGNECVSNMCRAVTRAMGECQRSADCPMGQVCGGPTTCNDHGCYACSAPRGMGAIGAACTDSTTCASGVCSYNHCSSPCTPGAAGGAECRALNPNLICAEFTYSVMMGASRVTLGTCVRGCGRNGDCTSPELCVPLLSFLSDRYDFICVAPVAGTMRTGAAGAPCTDGNTCQSALCVPPARGTGPGTCTAPCVTDADCTALAPVCGDLPLLRPSGGVQMSRGCMPRM